MAPTESWESTSRLRAVVYVVPRLLALSEDTPTITVRLDDEFWALKREQRVDLCQYINEYAQGCDVRLIATGRIHWRLYQDHREDICVSRDDIRHPDGGPISERVAEARNELDQDGREVQLLRWLADEDSETLSYSALDSRLTVGRSRRSQCLRRLSAIAQRRTAKATDPQPIAFLARLRLAVILVHRKTALRLPSEPALASLMQTSHEVGRGRSTATSARRM